MNVAPYASAYEYRPMIKHGPGFQVFPSKWERFWARVARTLWGIR